MLGVMSEDNENTVNVLGVIFVVINVTYAFTFFYGFHDDMKRTAEAKTALLESGDAVKDVRVTSLTRDASISSKLANSVKETEEDFDKVVAFLERTEGKAKARIIAEIGMIRSQVVWAIKNEL